ncbi:MAG: right-handed parallel beta-helix repeat-containing protein [Candidatus Lokiarchaeota archaeon]
MTQNTRFGGNKNDLRSRDNTKRVINLASQSGPKYIFNDNNWSDIANTYNWCNGSGTKNDPYVIKDLYFTTEPKNVYWTWPSTTIFIENTLEYFQIRNCTFFNCNDAIKLENVSNGEIINNIFTETDSNAIILNKCNNLTISNNNFTETYYNPIKLNNCNDVNISRNFIYASDSSPIFIDSSVHMNISRNIIEGGSNYGIHLVNVNDSYIEDNIVNFTGGGYCKIAIEYSNHNIIFNNSLINVGGNGLIIYHSNFNFISNNSIKGCSQGIEIFKNSLQNKILHNEIKTYDTGIYVQDYCNSNAVVENEIKIDEEYGYSDGIAYGIYLDSSNLNNVSLNYIKTEGEGITLFSSNMSFILNNTIYHLKGKCIGEYNCVNNTILGNICIRIPIPVDLSFIYGLIIAISICALVAAGAVIYYLRIRKRKLEKEIK